jgi:hypothetical protein
MKTTYTIIRYSNGWTVDSKTGDSLTDYDATFEDLKWTDDEKVAQADSLSDLIRSTFSFLLQTEEEGGLFIGCNEEPLETESEEEQEEIASL